MKRKFLFLLLIFLYLSSQAQELTIKSFTELTNDITARSNPRNDLNDNPCALVKVRMAVDNATFKGMIVGDVQHEGSEYYVYLPEGAKKITISAPSYLPIDVKFEDYGIGALVAKTTYLLTLSNATNNVLPIQTSGIQTGWIVLSSEPNDADVYINNEYVGKTPLGNCKKPYGHYKYKIEKNNYHSREGEFDLLSAKYLNNIRLKPAFGSINIKSEVSDVAIFLDGQQISQTSSCVLEKIASGTHFISIQKDKYAPFKQTIVVKDEEETLVNANLQARFSNITINSSKGAEIYVDGILKGISTYTDEIAEGFYNIEIKKQHCISVSKQLDVKSGINQTVYLEPTPILCSLDIVSTPINANVFVDGNRIGETPCTIDGLLEGDHMVELSLEGYGKITRNVSVNSEGSNILTVELNDQQVSEDKDTILEYAEQVPKFPGGVYELKDWIAYNIVYPKRARKLKIEGMVVCQFVVNEDGSISNVKVLKSVDEELDAEAVRVLSEMPKWKPGKHNGKCVKVLRTIPIKFKL